MESIQMNENEISQLVLLIKETVVQPIVDRMDRLEEDFKEIIQSMKAVESMKHDINSHTEKIGEMKAQITTAMINKVEIDERLNNIERTNFTKEDFDSYVQEKRQKPWQTVDRLKSIFSTIGQFSVALGVVAGVLKALGVI
jgi:ElaB/YqjD/DUF883 family membrane-anchored ribosome-binding protein